MDKTRRLVEIFSPLSLMILLSHIKKRDTWRIGFGPVGPELWKPFFIAVSSLLLCCPFAKLLSFLWCPSDSSWPKETWRLHILPHLKIIARGNVYYHYDAMEAITRQPLLKLVVSTAIFCHYKSPSFNPFCFHARSHSRKIFWLMCCKH